MFCVNQKISFNTIWEMIELVQDAVTGIFNVANTGDFCFTLLLLCKLIKTKSKYRFSSRIMT